MDAGHSHRKGKAARSLNGYSLPAWFRCRTASSHLRILVRYSVRVHPILIVLNSADRCSVEPNKRTFVIHHPSFFSLYLLTWRVSCLSIAATFLCGSFAPPPTGIENNSEPSAPRSSHRQQRMITWVLAIAPPNR